MRRAPPATVPQPRHVACIPGRNGRICELLKLAQGVIVVIEATRPCVSMRGVFASTIATARRR